MRRRWIAAALAASLLVAGAPAGAEEGAAAVTFPDEPRSWRERADLVMDHDSLAPLLRSLGYRYAGNEEIYLAEIVPGAGQPAMVMYDAGQGAFSQNFWPASSVKLLAAVAALEYAGSLGFSGDARVSASWIGDRTIRSVYEPAIVRSDNRSYDLLVRIAGIDYLNLDFAPRRGLDSVTIGSDLSGLPVSVSPRYVLTGWVPAGDIQFPTPPRIIALPATRTVEARSGRYYRSNNTDLFDLGEVVRRVLLHDEIPAEHRFALFPDDFAALAAVLCAYEPAHYRSGARQVWGDDAEVCGKSGWWERTPDPEDGEDAEPPPPSCTDVALITDPDTGRRLVVAATGGCGGGGLAALAGPAIQAAGSLSGTPLQPDSGVMDVALEARDGVLMVSIVTEAAGAIVHVDDGDPVVASRAGSGLEASLPLPADGGHVVVVRGLTFGVPSAYRAVDFDIGG